MTPTARITELEQQLTALTAQLAAASEQSHQAARAMYRRGYLAGHSAGRKNARRVRGPYGPARETLGA